MGVFFGRCMMKRRTLVLSAILLAAGAAIPRNASGAASKTEVVHFKSGSDTIDGYLALPAAAGKHPAVILIHEYWGLNDWIRDNAQKFADQGYAALAVDLYRGKVASDPGEAHELMRGLPQDRAIRDMEAAFDYLASRSDVDAQKIGVIGWCMGGGLALQLAVHEARLAACAVNYGALPTDSADIAKIRAPVLGNFGADDRGITPADVREFEKSMKAAGKSIDVKIYEGAGHAFENPNNKEGYRPEATADAWSRISAFFAKALK